MKMCLVNFTWWILLGHPERLKRINLPIIAKKLLFIQSVNILELVILMCCIPLGKEHDKTCTYQFLMQSWKSFKSNVGNSFCVWWVTIESVIFSRPFVRSAQFLFNYTMGCKFTEFFGWIFQMTVWTKLWRLIWHLHGSVSTNAHALKWNTRRTFEFWLCEMSFNSCQNRESFNFSKCVCCSLPNSSTCNSVRRCKMVSQFSEAYPEVKYVETFAAKAAALLKTMAQSPLFKYVNQTTKFI